MFFWKNIAKLPLFGFGKAKAFCKQNDDRPPSILEFGYRPLAAFVAQRRKKSDGSKHYSICQNQLIYLPLATF